MYSHSDFPSCLPPPIQIPPKVPLPKVPPSSNPNPPSSKQAPPSSKQSPKVSKLPTKPSTNKLPKQPPIPARDEDSGFQHPSAWIQGKTDGGQSSRPPDRAKAPERKPEAVPKGKPFKPPPTLQSHAMSHPSSIVLQDPHHPLVRANHHLPVVVFKMATPMLRQRMIMRW